MLMMVYQTHLGHDCAGPPDRQRAQDDLAQVWSSMDGVGFLNAADATERMGKEIFGDDAFSDAMKQATVNAEAEAQGQ